ncbi:unnamed protein product, partial [Rotaria sordida]
MWILHYTSDNNIQIFVYFIVLLILINTTNEVINIPTITFHNHSLSSNEFLNTTTLYSWKKSNSIEILKKLIANRQNLTKYNSKLLLLLTNNTQQIVLTSPTVNISNTTLQFQTITFNNKSTIDIQYSSTTNDDLLLFSSLQQTIAKKQSSNTTIFVLIFVFGFS